MKKGFVYIALATLLFSSMEIALKTISGQLNPIQLNLIRFFVGALLLLPSTISTLGKRKTVITSGDIGFFALTGFIGITLSMTLYQLSIISCKASIVAVVFSCNPVFTIPFAFFLLHEKIRPHTVVTMVLSLAGMAAIMSPFFSHGAGSLVGIFLTVLSAIAFSLYGVIGKFRTERFGGVATTCFSFFMASAEMLVLVLVSHIAPVSTFLKAAGFGLFADIPILGGITPSCLPTLAYVSILVTGIGYTCYFLAIETTSAAVASIVFYIKPALAPILALLILGESIAPTTILGIVLIASGSVVTLAFSVRKNTN